MQCEACGQPTTNHETECCGVISCDGCGCMCDSVRIPLADIDWSQLGSDLRMSATDAHDGQTPEVNIAYSFMLDNPECFLGDSSAFSLEWVFWPKDMPTEPPAALVATYYRITLRHAELWLAAHRDHQYSEVA